MRSRLAAIILLLCLTAPALATPLHPDITLRDADGSNVLWSTLPVSPLATCGACHDTGFITETSFHAWVGLGSYGIAPDTPGYLALDPVTYSHPLAQAAQSRSSIQGWLHHHGMRHPGLAAAPITDCTYEYNCFLCHTRQPDSRNRSEAISRGDYTHAATATLAATGLATPDPDGWTYNPAAFNPDGTVSAAVLGITNPSAHNCGQCHGPVHLADTPFTLDPDDIPAGLSRTGEVFSPQQPADSGLNLSGKAELSAPWDIHASRMLDCADCHFAGNNPSHADLHDPGAPGHLNVEARQLSIGEYLKAPDHSLARGYGSLPAPGGFPAGNMRRCADCHDPAAAHTWIPFPELHLKSLDCEACHIPRLSAPTRSMTDWTMLSAPSTPLAEYRGIDGTIGDPQALITGYEPLLLRRDLPDGTASYGPVNLQAAWFWVTGDQAQPVSLERLNAALFSGGAHHPVVITALDQDRDGKLTGAELQLTSEAAVAAVTERLIAVGVDSPRIQSVLKPYGIHHGVVAGQYATRDCSACHAPESKLAKTVTLAGYVPGGVFPEHPATGYHALAGNLATTPGGGLEFLASATDPEIYLAGCHRWPLIDLLGLVLFILVLSGVAGHALLRSGWARRINGGGN